MQVNRPPLAGRFSGRLAALACSTLFFLGISACTLPPFFGADPEINSASVSGLSSSQEKIAACQKLRKSVLGKTQDVAHAMGREVSVSVRTARIGTESFMVTMDYRLERLNIEIDSGVITVAQCG